MCSGWLGCRRIDVFRLVQAVEGLMCSGWLGCQRIDVFRLVGL